MHQVWNENSLIVFLLHYTLPYINIRDAMMSTLITVYDKQNPLQIIGLSTS